MLVRSRSRRAELSPRTRVTPGAYPVHLALADDEIALVMLLFSDAAPRRWKKAKPESFVVDSATGCLMDHRVSRFLRQKAEDGKYDRFTRRFDDALAESGSWGTAEIGSSGRVFLFRTWGGDGVFPVYFGFDDEGDPACLVIDMLPRYGDE
jgi:hypothetical protein